MKRIISESKRVATVGFSTDPAKPSHTVPRYMLEAGYEVIPVHPKADEILGQKVYRNLRDIPGEVDLVQLFRPSHKVMPHVAEAIEIGARFVWMQQGIANEEAAELARRQGIEVVMDRCFRTEHRRLSPLSRLTPG
jgi:predicted CoA-binding protein